MWGTVPHMLSFPVFTKKEGPRCCTPAPTVEGKNPGQRTGSRRIGGKTEPDGLRPRPWVALSASGIMVAWPCAGASRKFGVFRDVPSSAVSGDGIDRAPGAARMGCGDRNPWMTPTIVPKEGAVKHRFCWVYFGPGGYPKR